MFLWILLLTVGIVFLKYLYLLIKRVHLLIKIGKQVKKHNGSMCYCRNPMISIFKHDGKTDFSLCLQEKTVDVSVITTPFRRVRYHFDVTNKLLELIVEKRAMHAVNRSSPGAFVASADRVYTLRKYKIELGGQKDENPKYIILHPAPISISKAERTTLTGLYNNDTLLPGIKVCGLKWFVENVF